MNAPPGVQQQQQRGSVSYFLFLSLMFFMLSSSGPDTNAESHLRTALSRLKKERDDFEVWLYPHRASNRTASEERRNDTSSTSTLMTMPTTVPSNDTAGNGDSQGEQDPDSEEMYRPFILQDLTPPLILKDKIDLLLNGESSNSEDPVYYRNISGFFKGSWTAHPHIDVTDGKYNITEAATKQGRFPWTGSSRKPNKREGNVVRLNVREAVPHVAGMDDESERQDASIVILRGSLELQLHDMIDEKGNRNGETLTTDLDMEGVQYVFGILM